MKNNFVHVILILILVGLFILLSDPFMFWMPPFVVTCSLLAVAVIMCVLMGFVVKEQANDERELANRMNAGRAAYLSGLAVLTVAFIAQGFWEVIDPWVTAALVVMILSKFLARFYFDRYH